MRKALLLIFCAIIFNAWHNQAFAQISVSSALCENKVNPLGVPLRGLHFTWEMGSKQNQQTQTAYQLVISSSLQKIREGRYNVYDAGIIKSANSVMVKAGEALLKPAQTFYWRVRVWDKNHLPGEWSSIQQFTTGIFTEGDWCNAKWIGYEEMSDSMRVVPGVHEPDANSLGNKSIARPVVPLLRKKFITDKKVSKALLFITGLGQYEATVNGVKISNDFLSPGWTYYDKTVLYNTYDVTNALVAGDNTLGVIIGNGFYNINRERYFKITSAFGMPKMLCRLKIEYEDGTVNNIVSDESWRTAPSPITFTSIYGGEDYDARLEQEGWDTNLFDDSKWRNALVVKPPTGELLPQQDYAVAIMDSFTVKKISQPVPGIYMYDFAQNASGIIRLKIKGKKGQVVKLTPAELLNEKQLANQDASGSPYYLLYTLKSDKEEVWQPKFTYYGFRYVQVDGAAPAGGAVPNTKPVIAQLTSLHNRNSNPVNGSFQCSNPLFNRIYTLINWAIKSNLQSVVTDCPHREKLSWLEQDYLMGASIHYNYDVYSLYRQLVFDLIDAQYPQGFVPDIAPEFVVFDGGFLDSPEWGSSAVILPWLLYTWYGDEDILEKAYPMAKKYVDYLERKSNNYIVSHGLGDWFDYGPQEPGEAQLTPKAVTATSIFYYDAVLVKQMAALLHNKDDADKYTLLCNNIKSSFNAKFFNKATKVYSTGSQTAMAMPLCTGLAEASDKKAIVQNLVDSIKANNKALTAGDIGFHFLVKALDDGGASQLLYDMNNRDDVPGYGFQLKKGATALTESWPALEDVSNNHLMLGHIMEWFYSGLAGISQEDSSISFKHIKIRPQPVGDITSATGSFHCPYGWINTDWKKTGNSFTLNVRIPVNTDANIYLPATGSIFINNALLAKNKIIVQNEQAIINVGSGDYRIEVK